MKKHLVKNLMVFAAFVLLVNVSLGQNNKKPVPVTERYVISAKAGGVNFVSGNVDVIRKTGKNGYLVKGDSLEIGDKVQTRSTGKAEILLNPGSFVRLAENSEFEFVTTDLDDLRINVHKGSAIFEVIADSEFKVTVNTPKSRFYIVKTGIYRVDANQEGNAKIEVWKGKAQVEDGRGTILKGGQTIEGNSGLVAKFDRDEKDEFELWSKDRAKELDKINAKLRAREMNSALMSSFSQNGFGARNSFGLWVFDPFSRSYCFLPFGYGWSSPYGHWYDNSIWNYRIPQAVQNLIYSNPNLQIPQQSQPIQGIPSQPVQSRVPNSPQPVNNPPIETRPRPEPGNNENPRLPNDRLPGRIIDHLK